MPRYEYPIEPSKQDAAFFEELKKLERKEQRMKKIQKHWKKADDELAEIFDWATCVLVDEENINAKTLQEDAKSLCHKFHKEMEETKTDIREIWRKNKEKWKTQYTN